MSALIEKFEADCFGKPKQHPQFRPGDTVRINYKIEEGTKAGSTEKKFRLQAFEGVCLRFRNAPVNATFTVRKMGANGVGIERVFPINSPFIDSIELLSGGTVRRSRLYYLRELSGRAARITARRLPAGTLMKTVDESQVVTAKKKKKNKK